MHDDECHFRARCVCSVSGKQPRRTGETQWFPLPLRASWLFIHEEKHKRVFLSFVLLQWYSTPTDESSLTKLASNGAVSLNIQKEEEEEGMSAGQAHLPSKQQSHYGEEYGQNKEYIGGAHHCVVGELIWLSSNLLDVEAHWEYEGSHTEEDHCDRGKTQKEKH